MSRTVDLFDGCGGWAEGARALGLHPIGIELDRDACASSSAAGGCIIRADVTQLDPARFRPVEGLIASPPCPDFSTAGKRAGIEGETGRLMREVPRWVQTIRPRWVACEQVPPALEWWERFAHDFAKLGYRCWTGILNAADYGVPQTRQRAFLLASLERQPRPPEPTHTRHPMPGLFGDDLLPWVSMAAALGWDGFEAQYKRGAGMVEAAAEQSVDQGQRAHDLDVFDTRWRAWLPGNWEHSVNGWLDLGLTIDDLVRLIGATQAKPRQDPWKYFCGAAWGTLRQRQQRAHELIAASNFDAIRDGLRESLEEEEVV